MILTIDVKNKEFQVTRMPSPKTDQHGEQRLERGTDLPMWTTQVVVTDDDGGEVINITTAGDKPDLRVGDLVDVTQLIAQPWFTNGKSGVSYRAATLQGID